MQFEALYGAVRGWMESRSIRVSESLLGSGKAGEFDGISVTMNSEYELEERSYYLVHALGSIVLWSLHKEAIEELFANLRQAQENRTRDPVTLERMVMRYREFEIGSSERAVWLLSELRFSEAEPSYTNFMRADLEAMTEFHRTGKAPVWRTFFAHWNEEVRRGIREVLPFQSKAIRAFHPLKIATQDILQQQAES